MLKLISTKTEGRAGPTVHAGCTRESGFWEPHHSLAFIRTECVSQDPVNGTINCPILSEGRLTLSSSIDDCVNEGKMKGRSEGENDVPGQAELGAAPEEAVHYIRREI